MKPLELSQEHAQRLAKIEENYPNTVYDCDANLCSLQVILEEAEGLPPDLKVKSQARAQQLLRENYSARANFFHNMYHQYFLFAANYQIDNQNNGSLAEQLEKLSNASEGVKHILLDLNNANEEQGEINEYNRLSTVINNTITLVQREITIKALTDRMTKIKGEYKNYDLKAFSEQYLLLKKEIKEASDLIGSEPKYKPMFNEASQLLDQVRECLFSHRLQYLSRVATQHSLEQGTHYQASETQVGLIQGVLLRIFRQLDRDPEDFKNFIECDDAVFKNKVEAVSKVLPQYYSHPPLLFCFPTRRLSLQPTLNESNVDLRVSLVRPFHAGLNC